MLNGKLVTNKLIGCMFAFLLICSSFAAGNRSGILKNISMPKSVTADSSHVNLLNPTPPY